MENRRFKVDGEEATGSALQASNVITYRNEIYFYDEVTDKTIFDLRKCFIAAKEWIESDEAEEDEDCVVLYINSYGGEYLAGLAGYSFIKNFPHPVFSVIEGGAASAATFLYVAAEKKFMYKDSFILIHQLSKEMAGKFTDMVDDLHSSEKYMEKMKELYLDNTKINNKKLEELMRRDVWLTYEEAEKLGLVDGYYDTFVENKKKKSAKTSRPSKKK
jgi:ATP-dependent protease ClpP protease subunit